MSQLNISTLRGVPSTLDQVTVPTGHTLRISGALDLDTTSGYVLPSGTTAQRPSIPSIGMMRFNTQLGQFEVWSGAEWFALGGNAAGADLVGSYENPARSGIEVRDAGRPSGYYWIRPEGYSEIRCCYVDNTNYDGGWVLVMAVGSTGTTHYSTFESSNLYNGIVDGVSTNYVPFSGTGYSNTSTRRWDDCFIRDVSSNDNGGEEVFNLRIARNGAQPPGGVYDTYAGGTTTDWRYASFVRYNGGMQYFSSLNTGGDGRQGDRREGTYSVSHTYPYNWERPGGYDHMRVADANYKVFDYHSSPSSLQTSRYSVNRILWGYTGTTSNGIYGGSAAFSSNQGNPGYMFVR